MVPENEVLVFWKGSSRRDAELISPERRDGGWIKIVTSIECTVAQELIGAAVKAIGAGARDSADDAARRTSVFSALIRGQHGKLGDCVYTQVAAQDAARGLVRVVV